MDTDIKKHFEQLGNLELGIDIDDKSSVHVSVTNIEGYLGRKIDEAILELLVEYQGKVFMSDETIGIQVEEKIPILGDSGFLEFGIFMTLNKSTYGIESILKSNEDLFEKTFLPFAEATPGDYIAYNFEDKTVFFISHDFNDNEKFRFRISDNLKSYCMALQNKNEKGSKPSQENDPKLIKVTYNADFLKKAKEEAQKMKEKKAKKE